MIFAAQKRQKLKAFSSNVKQSCSVDLDSNSNINGLFQNINDLGNSASINKNTVIGRVGFRFVVSKGAKVAKLLKDSTGSIERRGDYLRRRRRRREEDYLRRGLEHFLDLFILKFYGIKPSHVRKEGHHTLKVFY